MASSASEQKPSIRRQEIDDVVIRFAGDSGDGMQLTGTEFTKTAALVGNDLATFPDFPAEIRAPVGTTFGVSAFQIHFSSHDIYTPGDQPDVLVAMNPAALVTNIGDLKKGGLLVVNSGAFTEGNLIKAGYKANPLEDGSLEGKYKVLKIDITKLNAEATVGAGLSSRETARCKNFWTLGLMYWMYSRPIEPTLNWIGDKFGKKDAKTAEANSLALKAGFNFGETAEIGAYHYFVPAAKLPAGKYRNISGNQATAWGIIAAGQLSGLPVLLGSYPITPASDILHELSMYKHYNVSTFQAEDEIAAIGSAIGAAYAGGLGFTTSSGPGIALKTEMIGIALAVELPLVIIDVQRGGPSTGLPTKTEQSDLLQAIYGRNGDSPMPVIAAATSADCFAMVIEASRIAVEFMTPVLLLTDGYLANGSEPWKIPDVASLPKIDVKFRKDPQGFHPFVRDEKLARAWAIPGTPGLRHRIGGIEKDYDSGNISYAPMNHERMTKVRAQKVANVAKTLPPAKIEVGAESGDLLVVSWGSTHGAVSSAVRACHQAGMKVGHLHLRYMNPMQSNVGDIIAKFKRVLVPEMNNGQLVKILRSTFLCDAQGLNKIQGKPFKVSEVEQRIKEMLGLAKPVADRPTRDSGLHVGGG